MYDVYTPAIGQQKRQIQIAAFISSGRSSGEGLSGSARGYTIGAVDAWTFIWLMFLLKIPIVALFLIVRWAVRQTTEPAAGEDGGVGPRPQPRHPHRPARPRGPRSPRRGPHGEPALASPPRMRTRLSRKRLPHR
jgi:hypothetical protein